MWWPVFAPCVSSIYLLTVTALTTAPPCWFRSSSLGCKKSIIWRSKSFFYCIFLMPSSYYGYVLCYFISTEPCSQHWFCGLGFIHTNRERFVWVTACELNWLHLCAWNNVSLIGVMDYMCSDNSSKHFHFAEKSIILNVPGNNRG